MNSDFKTVVILNTNKSVDLAADIYSEVAPKTNFAWKIYNIDVNSTSQIVYEKMFFIYVLDSLVSVEYDNIFHFINLNNFNYAERTIVLVKNKSSISSIKSIIQYSCLMKQFFSFAFIFWEHPIQYYICSGYDNLILTLAFENSICPSDIAERLYYDKMIDMHGANLNVLTVTNPPRVFRTVGRYENDEIISNIDGLDVMLSDVIAAVLNATFTYAVVTNITRLVGHKLNSTENITYGNVEIFSLVFSESLDMGKSIEICETDIY